MVADEESGDTRTIGEDGAADAMGGPANAPASAPVDRRKRPAERRRHPERRNGGLRHDSSDEFSAYEAFTRAEWAALR